MKTFKQTCNKPYDRHFYRVGNRVTDNWQDATYLWAATKLPIEVLDRPNKPGKGF